MNAFDRALLTLFPGWAADRAQARVRALAYQRAYEADETTRLRRKARDAGSGNAAIERSGTGLRNLARHMERNHDIVRGALNALVTNTIGPTGIGIEPQPRNAAGDIDEGLVDQITPLWREWQRRPEVSWMHDWASAQRLMARTWYRDGEVLAQELTGPVQFLDHGTQVPYSIEMIEPDLLPFDYSDPDRRILQGVERNAWGRAIAYHLYRQHPGDPGVFAVDTKRVPAAAIRHARMVDRIGQVRGVSILAAVLTRLDDLKDYEESERIAAKIAASMAAYIIKGEPGDYTSDSSASTRQMHFEAGMVFDDLRQGESIGTIDTKRPNSGLQAFRDGQLRAVAAGMCVSFSTLSKNYNGTYSAQRQELVEQYGAYGVLSFEFISQMVRPIYERFVSMAVASGELVVPRGVPMASLTDALYLAPQMPWIDPRREAESMAIMEENTYMSGPEIIRRGGRNPREVLDQQSAWLERKRAWGIPAKGQAQPDEEPVE